MKRVLWALAGLLLSACSSDNPEQSGGNEFEPSTRNGRIVCALADAYAAFESTDRLPATVTVDGQTLDKGACWEAAARLVLKRKATLRWPFVLVAQARSAFCSTAG